MRNVLWILGVAGVLAGTITTAKPDQETVRVRIEAVKSVSALADDLLREFGKKGQDENLLFSPLSISTAFAMLYGGAEGETEEELRRAMHFSGSPAKTHAGSKFLAGTLNMHAQGYELRTANALFPQTGYPIKPAFEALLKTDYSAEVSPLDLAGEPADAAAAINAWIERQTAKRIRNMVSPDRFTRDTRFVLANAVYFKAGWAHPFTPEYTRSMPFQPLAGKPYPVNMMHLSEKFLYLETPLVQVVELPYARHRHSMIILLPKKADALPEVERRFVDSMIGVNLDKLRPTDLRLSIPRFEIDQPTIDLKPLCQKLGVKRVFDSEQAQLGGISDEPGLFIDFALHKAWIRVDEEGTEAAAATMEDAGGMGMVGESVVVNADHPFLFAIRDRATNALLFLGRLAKPPAAQVLARDE